mmetsp:Transcript_40909/g.75678  ORF Transcript_40909/g.75678 Transcript_40909/m.75678 type:complete len:555 (-) Transcript_40909:6-1670(-)|eukprot:CAMPEP_0197468464 /NCGR_PEP_ID=MMETSP1175-20131217/66092_1 /TAXON_ID=1003142 /ORGANISM="Triceratium dubium, Strain CCMP147" /LENGTH=554 /DNA_ID=CAMNT_0043004563 /DNA_START=315 /DNA_END=1979 /DNA_ORIENTATION=-
MACFHRCLGAAIAASLMIHACFLEQSAAFSLSQNSLCPIGLTERSVCQMRRCNVHSRPVVNLSGGRDDDVGEEVADGSQIIFVIGSSDEEPPDEEQRKRTDGWLRWMTGGKRSADGASGPRGVADVKMREAAELGGLPRSDRYSSRDWFHNTKNLLNSGILRDVLSPVLFMTSWASLVSVVYRMLLKKSPVLAEHMAIPTTPHSFMVSTLGLLLVFRTNSAYQRFAEGRKIWDDIMSVSRDLSRMAKLYEVEIGAEKRRRVQRLLAAFPYLLRYRIRPNSVKSFKKIGDPGRNPDHSLLLYQDVAANDNDIEAATLASEEETIGMSRRRQRELYWVDSRTLPWRLLPGDAMKACARAQNRPLWVCDRMAKELASVPDGPNFTNRERLHLVGHCDKLSRAIGACERIHQTVVPLNYARHALRALTMWLLSLPFALVRDLGLLTGPTLCVVSWMLFGVYEIGTKIEDPFQGTLRLSILCDQIRRDVLADELIRDTAFRLDTKIRVPKEPVPLASDGEDDDEDDEHTYELVPNPAGLADDGENNVGLNGSRRKGISP